jgi:hypothetical protein
MCVPRTAFDCSEGCPAGERCMEVYLNPCVGKTCESCSSEVTMCLPKNIQLQSR